jgi:hypothetical protein
MSYIGRGTESISNVEVLDNLTFDGSASYTLQKSSVNFVPSSANNLLISISGVVQQGNFSVSGSTITFDTTVSGSDTCDWILHYGTGLITTVADGAITEAKLGSNAVTTAKINNGAVSYAKTDGNFGKIGQIVQATLTTVTTSTSTSFATTNFSASITPTSTSSKILIQCSIHVNILNATNDYAEGEYKIYRNGSSLDSTGRRIGGYAPLGNGGSSVRYTVYPSFTLLDSPASTSSVTYELYFRTVNNSNENNKLSDGSRPSSITLMEVLA